MQPLLIIELHCLDYLMLYDPFVDWPYLQLSPLFVHSEDSMMVVSVHKHSEHSQLKFTVNTHR